MNTTARRSALVTGASGFIGTHLVRRLVTRGYRVSCLVRASSPIDELRAAGADLLECEIDDRVGVSRAVAASKARVVFHVAGLLRAMASRDFMRVNAEGVDAVAAACMAQADPTVLVLVSSIAAAGPSGEASKTERDSPLPVSDYGRSKLAGEEAAARYAAGVPITIVRPSVVFGAGDRGFFELWKPIARTGIHVVPAGGDRRLSLIAVQDLVDCIVLAAEKGERLVPDGPGRGIYFAAAADLSHRELGRAIADALGKADPRVVHLPEWAIRTIGFGGDVMSQIRRRPGWVGRDKVTEMLAGSWTCSSAKARRQLGWSPAAPLQSRLRETARWYFDAHWL
ncbi:MAG: SDR family NAD(P)-dependent oxidoreductase [Betaproteobacteria bacterium]